MQYQRKILSSLLIASGIISVPQVAVANDSSELEQLRALVQELDQKVRILARQDELAVEKAEADRKKTPVVKAGNSGFGLESADGKYKIKAGGYFQVDSRNWINDDLKNQSEGFTFRRIRPTISGTIAGIYDFRFTPEFGENKSAALDAYIDARFKPYANLRVGKFKPFIGLERLQSGSNLKFIERSYVSNNLLPNRDLGAALHGKLFEGKLDYAVGIHNGVADGAESTTKLETESDKDYAVRLFATPFKGSDSALAGLGVGIAATYADQRGSASDTRLTGGYKTPGQTSDLFKFATGTYADGQRIRWSPQAYYYYGPFGVLAEYARVSQDVTKGANHANLDNDAWQIAASWLLTGEDASYGAVKPKQDFDLDKGTWGAWEIALRYQEINIDSKAFTGSTYSNITTSAESAQSWAGGINWYLNQNVKFNLNYERTNFDGGGGGTVAAPKDREDEQILFGRIQLSL